MDRADCTAAMRPPPISTTPSGIGSAPDPSNIRAPTTAMVIVTLLQMRDPNAE